MPGRMSRNNNLSMVLNPQNLQKPKLTGIHPKFHFLPHLFWQGKCSKNLKWKWRNEWDIPRNQSCFAIFLLIRHTRGVMGVSFWAHSFSTLGLRAHSSVLAEKAAKKWMNENESAVGGRYLFRKANEGEGKYLLSYFTPADIAKSEFIDPLKYSTVSRTKTQTLAQFIRNF